MVSAWGLGFFLAGMALVAVELAYPRRYVGVIGLDLAAVGLVLMYLPESTSFPVRVAVLAVTAIATAAIAIPFYRRYAPAVGPMHAPGVVAGDFAIAEENIQAGAQGLVRAGGILWTAQTDQPVQAGQRVRILVIEPDRLWVEPDSDTPPQGDPSEN